MINFIKINFKYVILRTKLMYLTRRQNYSFLVEEINSGLAYLLKKKKQNKYKN